MKEKESSYKKMSLLATSIMETDKEQAIDETLKRTAWNVLHDNPGCECQDWIDTLVNEYSSEVVDVFGDSPEDVFASLADWWDCMDYEDEGTGMCETFSDWAEYFATERSVELYDLLVEAKNEIKRLNNEKVV